MTKNQPISLRVATVADTWAIQRLFEALHAYNASLDPRFELAEGWEAVLDDHLDRLWKTGGGEVTLAWRGDEPVGLLIMNAVVDSPLFRHREWAELQSIFVDPSVRGTPVAARLVAAGMTWARSRGYDRIQLFVTATNLPAKRFYDHLGFYPVQEIWRLELGADDDPLPDGLRRRLGLEGPARGGEMAGA